jgi:hypothetical protein
MSVRISEIGIDADYLEEYKAILKEEAELSVRLEPGVIAIFPMYQKDNPTARTTSRTSKPRISRSTKPRR